MTPDKKRRGRSRAAEKGATVSQVPKRKSDENLAAGTNLRKSSKSKKKVLSVTNNISPQSTIIADESDEINQPDIDHIQIEDLSPKKLTKRFASRSKATKETSNVGDENIEKSPKVRKTAIRQPLKNKKHTKKATPPENFSEKLIVESQDPDIRLSEELDEDVERDLNSIHDQTDTQANQKSKKRRLANSTLDEERESDNILKRRCVELNEKYESLQSRYNEVVEVGIKEAERNFDKLQKQIEENMSVTNSYLSSLKSDLKKQTSLASETKSLKKKLSAANMDTESLQAKVQQLESSLAEIQAENKTLSTKLVANRAAAASVESVNSKVQNSAIKANGGIRMMGTVEAAQAAQAAQLKEDLYSDLTGLLMRSVTRGTEKDCFDCIQTGRNGTLHFKLTVGNESSADSYDDIQCSYSPLLDPSRDKMLMELLPDYLLDVIAFPRPHAAKFYARVVKALTEKFS